MREAHFYYLMISAFSFLDAREYSTSTYFSVHYITMFDSLTYAIQNLSKATAISKSIYKEYNIQKTRLVF